jgi:hypothetical protein
MPAFPAALKPLPMHRRLGSVPRMAQDPNEPEDGNRRRSAVIGLLVTALLVVAGYYLMTSLRENGRLQDCLMSGRTNCAPLDIPTHK